MHLGRRTLLFSPAPGQTRYRHKSRAPDYTTGRAAHASLAPNERIPYSHPGIGLYDLEVSGTIGRM